MSLPLLPQPETVLVSQSSRPVTLPRSRPPWPVSQSLADPVPPDEPTASPPPCAVKLPCACACVLPAICLPSAKIQARNSTATTGDFCSHKYYIPPMPKADADSNNTTWVVVVHDGELWSRGKVPLRSSREDASACLHHDLLQPTRVSTCP